MKKLVFTLFAIVTMAFASGGVIAQGQSAHVGGRPGSGWNGGGGNGGGWHGGGWNGGGWNGGGWHGGGWRGGGWNGGWHGPRVGIFVGYPGYWGAWPYPNAYSYPAYYPYPAYGPSELVYVPSEPTTYVQRGQDAPSTSSNYWYYCTDPAGYFPYVENCAKAWIPVVPQRNPNAPNVLPAQ